MSTTIPAKGSTSKKNRRPCDRRSIFSDCHGRPISSRGPAQRDQDEHCCHHGLVFSKMRAKPGKTGDPPHATVAINCKHYGRLPASPRRHSSTISTQSEYAQWMRGVPRHGRHLGPPAVMSAVWTCRLLRLVEKQARHEALSQRPSSRHPVLRTGRALAVVLRG
jgi:hypothetical protein